MSTSVRLTDTQYFPPGTVLRAYKARGGAHPFPGPLPPARGMAPPAAAPVIAEGTMGNEALTLTGLEDDTMYVVGGQVAGEWRWQTTRTQPAVGGGTVTVVGGFTQGEADARYLQLTDAQANYARLIESSLKETITTGTHTLPLEPELWLLFKSSPALTMPTPEAGMSMLVAVQQDAVGSRVPVFTGVKWPEAVLPTWSQTANAIDLVSFVAVVGAWLGTPVGFGYG